MPARTNLASTIYLQECLAYCRGTPSIRWRLRPLRHFRNGAQTAIHNQTAWNNKFAGRVAGHPRWDGRWTIRLDGILCMRSRIVWKLAYDEEPPEHVDHIDGDPSNDRIDNLRAATQAENQWNKLVRKDSSSGLRGAIRHHSGKSFSVITVNGVRHYLGLFNTPEEAAAAYAEASARLHGKFGRTK